MHASTVHHQASLSFFLSLPPFLSIKSFFHCKRHSCLWHAICTLFSNFTVTRTTICYKYHGSWLLSLVHFNLHRPCCSRLPCPAFECIRMLPKCNFPHIPLAVAMNVCFLLSWPIGIAKDRLTSFCTFLHASVIQSYNRTTSSQVQLCAEYTFTYKLYTRAARCATAYARNDVVIDDTKLYSSLSYSTYIRLSLCYGTHDPP